MTPRRTFLKSSVVASAIAAVAEAQPLFPGFEARKIQTSGATIHTLRGGSGPPLLLIHGYPQTHVEWHKIAPELAQRFTVVMVDLRGYGDSSKPPEGENHSNYSKRAMALDQVEVMHALGYDRFAVVGHDRGARVTWRLAVEHPQVVTKAAVLDIVPLPYSMMSREFATQYFHWFFLIQPAPFPETLIGNSVEYYLRSRFLRPTGGTNAMTQGSD
jgi:haloacetate dehalogenase